MSAPKKPSGPKTPSKEQKSSKEDEDLQAEIAKIESVYDFERQKEYDKEQDKRYRQELERKHKQESKSPAPAVKLGSPKSPTDTRSLAPLSEKASPAQIELYIAVRMNDIAHVKKILLSDPTINLDLVPLESDLAHLPIPKNLPYPLPHENELNSPLLLALSIEGMEIAHLLLDKGANPWRQNRFELSALHMLAMVRRNMTAEKAQQVMHFLQKLIQKDETGFKREINRVAPPDDPRNPIALSITYQDPKTMMEFLDICMAYGGVYKGRGPLWGTLIHASDRTQKFPPLFDRFPEEWTLPKLHEQMDAHTPDTAFIAACKNGDVNLAELCFKLDPKTCHDLLNKKYGLLHLVLDNLRNATDPKPWVELMKLLISKGADPTLKNLLNKSVIDRFKELPTKPGSFKEEKEIAEQLLVFLNQSKPRP